MSNKWTPSNESLITDGYFQCGAGLKPKKRFKIRRDLLPVGEAVRAALDYRDEHAPTETLYIAIYTKRPDGLMARYSAAIPRGARTAAWELSG